jgi:superfamily II DNA or RNA helicase
VINAVIRQGYVWLVEPDYEIASKINDILTFEVPGAEHSPQFKKGIWDGRKGFMNWHYKNFSVGLFYYVKKKTGFEFNILEDDRKKIGLQYIPFKVKGEQGEIYDPYDFVIDALKKVMEDNGGLVGVATNGGKTSIISGLCLSAREHNLKICIMVHLEALLWQIREEVYRNVDIDLGAITANRKSLNMMTIMMVPTVNRMIGRIANNNAKPYDEKVYSFLQAADIFICDEVHHGKAATWMQMLNLSRTAMRFGCSGTVPDEDTVDGIEIRELFGSQVIDVRNKELIDRGISAKPEINMIEYSTEVETEQFKAFKKEVQKDSFKWRGTGENDPKTGKEILKREFSVPTYTHHIKTAVMDLAIKENFGYWKMIGQLLYKHKSQSVVIFTDWIQYCEELAEYLGIEYMNGQNVSKRPDQLARFTRGDLRHLVVTSVLDEGLSINLIKVLIFANAGSSKRQFKQRIGRGLRRKLDDNTLIVYDFLRYGHKYLLKASVKRLRLWEDEGFDVRIIEDFKELLK